MAGADKRPWWILRLALTAIVVGWLTAVIDWQSFWKILRNANMWLVAAVVLLRFGGLALSAVKWRQLLTIHGRGYRLWQLVRWYLVAVFLNIGLPTSIGGDAYRVYQTLDIPRGRSCAMLAVLVERVTGFTALLLLGLASGIAIYLASEDPVSGGLAVLCGILIIAVALATWGAGHLEVLRRLPLPGFVRDASAVLSERALDYKGQPGGVVTVCLLSLLFHVNKILVVWLLLLALGAQASPLETTLSLVVSETAGMLPITLGGLGLVEGSFAYAMEHFGVSAEIGVGVMLLLRVLLVPTILLGAYYYFVGDGKSVSELGGASPSGHTASGGAGRA